MITSRGCPLIGVSVVAPRVELGTLPHASVNDLQLAGPSDSYIIAATHGRGLWKIATP
jgi:hypothetical protein